MTTTGGLYSRPDKLNDAQTVLYEVDMLRFAKERLLFPQSSRLEGDEWVHLEDFLLHYRNLIEFFSGKPKYPDDLSISRPENLWPGQIPEKAVLDFMTRPALWEKYDTPGNPQAISKYLHHCTMQRAIKKGWDVNAMYEDLRPIIEKLESLLPEYKSATQCRTPKLVASLSADATSTASTRLVDLG